MYLHENVDLFNKILNEVVNNYGFRQSIVEKDYYVFMLLKYLVETLGYEFVFKGGTSLSKAYGIIERFSEDIDLCLQKEKIKSGGARKRIVVAVFDGFEVLGLKNSTIREVQRHGDYNDLRGSYTPVSTDNTVEPYIKVETAHRIREYPYEYKQISSYIGDYLYKIYGNYGNFCLEPFNVLTVSVYRTFVDKLFAIADYYMSKKVKRYSRHLYDVYKIINIINWSDYNFVYSLRTLINDVREERVHYKKCKSAQDGVVLKDVLYQALVSDYYKDDYNSITMKILYENIPYEYCKIAILNLLNSALFT